MFFFIFEVKCIVFCLSLWDEEILFKYIMYIETIVLIFVMIKIIMTHDLLQVFVDSDNFQGISNRTIYLSWTSHSAVPQIIRQVD